MILSDIKLKPDYNKAIDNIAEEFYIPCMSASIEFDRITGYFGSTVYIIAWKTIKSFVARKGRIRIICSPYIDNSDVNAIDEGYKARLKEDQKQRLVEEITDMFNSPYLNRPSRALAGLIAMGVVDIKIALAPGKVTPDVSRLFHDKVGIFRDNQGNCVGFRGSMNETYKGLSSDGNIESIDVFPNWMDDRDKLRADKSSSYFNQLWNNTVSGIDVYPLPDNIHNLISAMNDSENWENTVDEVVESLDAKARWLSMLPLEAKALRNHQIEALLGWEQNGFYGIFEHATGSGKTYTAICAMRYLFDRDCSAIVVVPSISLLSQWKAEIEENLSDLALSILVCGDDNDKWKSNGLLKAWTRKSTTIRKCILVTADTASSELFVSNIEQGNHLLIIADEVHRLGSPKRKRVFQIDSGHRLGLSATPIRFGDINGTMAIFDYFGQIIPPVFSLKDAIMSNVLTKYFYYPHEVCLNGNEQDSWDDLTAKIGKLTAIQYNQEATSPNLNERLKLLQIQRARIVKNALSKVELAADVIKKFYEKGQRWIVYCDNQIQVNQVIQKLLEQSVDVYEYHSSMSGDRSETLKYFTVNGGIIVSIRCLDEGVDIPNATHALILASSTNPREFIQRRGRILRKYPGKHFAYLHDAIVLPNVIGNNQVENVSIIEGELSRSIQFGEWAENPACITKLNKVAIEFGINIDKAKNGGFEDETE